MMATIDKARMGEAGFTLLELLISMAVLGLLTVLMFSSLTFGTRVWERSENVTVALNKIRSVQELLRSDVSGLYPAAIGGAGESHVDFDGSADSVTFLRPNADIPGAFERVTLSMRGEAGALTEN